MFGLDPYVLWFLAAILLIGYELLAGFSVLFLFLMGLSALCVGFASYFSYIDPNDYTAQLIIFLTLFVLFFVLFWKPIKRIMNQNSNAKYNNIVGQKAEVIIANISKSKSGKVKWSGTEINAELSSDNSDESVGVGEFVEIVEIKDNTFIVKTIK